MCQSMRLRRVISILLPILFGPHRGWSGRSGSCHGQFVCRAWCEAAVIAVGCVPDMSEGLFLAADRELECFGLKILDPYGIMF